MKKLMIVGLVAACACAAEAGVITRLASALTDKKVVATVASPAAKVIDVESADLMSLSKSEFEQVLVQANTKTVRRSLVARLGKLVDSWDAPKLLRPVKAATLKVLHALRDAERWADSHWKNYVAPTLRNAWDGIREFFGGKKK